MENKLLRMRKNHSKALSFFYDFFPIDNLFFNLLNPIFFLPLNHEIIRKNRTHTRVHSLNILLTCNVKGCYVHGLFLEGARWSIKNQSLERSLPKVLVEPLPILSIQPIETHRLKLQVSFAILKSSEKS